MNDLASSRRAVTCAHFLSSNPATLLRGILSDCRTRADMLSWSEDYQAHHHLLTEDERASLVRASAPRFIALWEVRHD